MEAITDCRVPWISYIGIYPENSKSLKSKSHNKGILICLLYTYMKKKGVWLFSRTVLYYMYFGMELVEDPHLVEGRIFLVFVEVSAEEEGKNFGRNN